MSGAELARALEMLPGTYRQIESGRRRLKFELASQIAIILDCTVDELITGEISTERVPLAPALTSLNVDLPVFGSFDLSGEMVLVDSGNKIARHPIVADVKSAYAMHIANNDAGPRFEIGDTIIVDPTKPVSNQWAVVGISRDDKVIAQIHKVEAIDAERSLLRLTDGNTISLENVVSVDLIVDVQLV